MKPAKNQNCMGPTFGSALALIAGALLASPAVNADWLVTRDGAVLETAGAWEVKGKLVTFELPNGRLSSMRMSELDLEASTALTARKATPESAEEPQITEPQQAVMVLTDADVKHVAPQIEAAEGAAEDTASDGDKPDQGSVTVTGWKEELDVATSTVQIAGSLANRGPNPATSIVLAVMLYHADGGLLARTEARLNQRILQSGESTGFSAAFPDVMTFAAVKFDVKSRGFRTRSATQPDQPETPDGP